MVKRMLIDATHAEETRVVVLDGTRLDEFDVETSTKKQIKGNIYLAKVVRVEPSLQAAFVDYGGNRHGFLAFSEIHPDYYQIPVADREKLLAEVRRQRELDDRHAIESIDDAPPAPSQYVEHESGASDRIPDVIPTDLPPGLVDDAAGDRPAQALEARAPAITSDTLEGETGADDAPYRPRNDGDFAFADLGGRDGGDDTPSPDRMGPETMGPETMGTDTSSTAARDTADADPIAPEAAQETTHDTADSATEVAGETFADIGAESANGATGDAPVETAPRGEIIEAPSAPVSVDVLGGEEAEEAEEVDDSEKQRRRFLAQRHYKIQEVIKRRQIMLVQVVKEERGNKGAALTTYLSLAGRYCVLMPNSSRGGGVSRKITSAADRRRLKSIISELETPPSMAVILRTAGSERSKAEIKRDYEYLMRTWDNIRDVTMQSRAPALIHEEASLIKRAIRDVYSRDIEEVLVEGEDGFKIAKDFMKMLTPSHAKKVQRYADDVIPLFQRYQVESQLEAMNTPTVQLRSGGSIVFGQTEALVAIDVNSGRATRERHIEETALKTNLEAADEIARQLRLRDLAGLVVIDFIDMEESRNNHAVERRLKEALRNDRARIQVGRISHFGLLELSRQRLRPSLIETNYRPCPHCGGTGHVRSTESAAIYALRMIEEEGVRKRSSELTVTVHPSVALYLLNHKRSAIASMETRFALRIFVLGDEALVAPALRIDRVKMTRAAEEALAAQAAQQAATRALAPPVEAEPEDEDEPEIEDDAGDNAETEDRETDGGARRPSGRHQARDEAREDSRDDNRGEGGVRRRRRRRRRGRRDERDFDDTRGPQSVAGESQELGARAGQNADPDSGPVEIYAAPAADVADTEVEADGSDSGSGTDDRGRRRRRGRRGGRRRRREFGDNAPGSDAGDDLRDLRAPPSDETGEAIFAAPPLPAADAGPVDFIAPAASPSTGTRNDDEAGRGGAGRLFRAIRDTALSWARPEPRAEERTESRTESRPEPYDAPRAPAPESAPSPAAIVVQPEPVQPAPVAREPDPAPAARPVAPPEPPPGPPRKGWWNQAGS